MSVCTFFGHRECPGSVTPFIRVMIEHLITDQGVRTFYVGNQGQFDRYVRGILQALKKDYPYIVYRVVLAYMPGKKREYEDLSDTLLPEGIETVPRRFAISWRNNWMLRQSDYVITYITHSFGGAAQFAEKAKKQGKWVFNVADLPLDMVEDLLQNETELNSCSAADCEEIL